MVRTNMEVAMWTGVVGFRKEMDGAERPALDVRTVLRSLDGSEATVAAVSSSLLPHSSPTSPVYSQVS